jgi:hypothetical protein
MDMEVVFDSNIATSSVFGVAAGDVLRAAVSCCQLLSAAVSVGRGPKQRAGHGHATIRSNTQHISLFSIRWFFFQKDVIEVL